MAWHAFRAMRREEEEERERKYSDLDLFKLVLGLFRYYLPEAISLLLIVIATSIFAALVPMLLQKIIDLFIKPNNTGFKPEIAIMAGLFLLFIVLNFVLTLTRSIMFAKLGQRIIFRIRNDVFSKLQYQSQEYFTETESGRTISKVTNDVDALGELLTSGIIDIFADLFSLGWIIGIMFSYDTKMTLFTFTVVPILLIVVIIFKNRVRGAYRRTRVAIAKVTANLQETIQSAKVTKTLSREDENIQKFRDLNKETFSANVEAAGISSLFMPIIQIVAAIGTTIILIYGGYALKFGDITYGELFAFLQYSSMFFNPIMNLFTFYTLIQSGFAAGERIFEILDEDIKIKNCENPIILENIKGHIEFKSVDFNYNIDVPVLNNIQLDIKPGQSIALVGRTGAGKTTITKLLARYYDVSKGELLVDGHNIKEIELTSLRRNIAVVPQDVFLFSGTIIENLKFGNKKAQDQEVYSVCKTLGLHSYITKLSEGYQTDVREGGSRLSLGQRQLISLARAVIADPRILILDECTSSIDPITESLIQKGIDYILKDRTSIIIAHRLSTIKSASKIIVIDEGGIIEEGTHDQLLRKKGKYFNLYQTQITSNIID